MAVVLNPPQGPLRASVAFGVPKLDWSNPITLGMVDCLVWNAGGTVPPPNLASPSIATTLVGSPADTMTSVGPAGLTPSNSGYNVAQHLNYCAGDFTARLLFLPVTWPNGFTTIIDKSVGGREFSVFMDTSGNMSYCVIGGSNPFPNTGTLGMAIGSVYDFVMVRTGTVLNFYVNNVLKITASSSGTSSIPGLLSFGPNTSGGGAGANAKYITAQMWTRALDPSEISLLYNDPFNFLIPAEGEMPALSSPSIVPTTYIAFSVIQ